MHDRTTEHQSDEFIHHMTSTRLVDAAAYDANDMLLTAIEAEVR